MKASPTCALILSFVLFSSASYSQSAPVCTIGKPCGNACIAQTDTCWVGSGSATGNTNGRQSDPNMVFAVIVGALALTGISLLALFYLSKKSNEMLDEEGKKLRNKSISLSSIPTTS